MRTKAKTKTARTVASPHTRPLVVALETGSRILLRLPTRRDAAEWIALREASWDHLKPWEGTPPGRRKKPTHAEAFERQLKTSNLPTNRRFVICLRATGAIIGQISLNNIVRGAFQTCHCGYWIGAAYAGQGFMTEALTLALRHAFKELKLHRVEANMLPRNAASRAVVKKCGLHQEGLATNYLRINHHWEDHEIWAITAEEWKP